MNDVSFENRIKELELELRSLKSNLLAARQVEKSTQKRAEQFQIITEQIVEMIYMTDNNGNINYVSKAVEKIFGFTQEEMVGKHFSVFLSENDISEALSLFQKSLSTEAKNTTHELHMKHKDNSMFIGELSGSVYIKDGHISTIGLIRDITKRKQIQEKLNENENVLQKLNTDKDLFISILSHDLKSPFSNILGLSEILMEGIHKLNIEEVVDIASNINISARNTFNLLEDILLWARTQQGKIPFKPQKLNFIDICNDILKTLNSNANAKNITINCPVAEKLNIYADIDMLKTVLRNLVSNAIKFTNSGGAINISANKNTGSVTISVSDNGIGIKPDNLAKLFDISQVLTTTGTANESGTGLGLLICKELIEKHNGKIWIESDFGKGSDFKFSLPISTEQAT